MAGKQGSGTLPSQAVGFNFRFFFSPFLARLCYAKLLVPFNDMLAKSFQEVACLVESWVA